MPHAGHADGMTESQAEELRQRKGLEEQRGEVGKGRAKPTEAASTLSRHVSCSSRLAVLMKFWNWVTALERVDRTW